MSEKRTPTLDILTCIKFKETITGYDVFNIETPNHNLTLCLKCALEIENEILEMIK